MRTKLVFIKDIMDSPPTNSGLQKKDVLLAKESLDLIPVYSASQNETLVFGWVKTSNKWKCYENVLTWNKDGSSGRVFYRKEKFIPYEKVKVLRIKPEFTESLGYSFLKYVVEDKLLSLGFGFKFKCSMTRVLNETIKIPIDKNGDFNLEKQKELAGKYKKIHEVKNKLQALYEEIISLKVVFEDTYTNKQVLISEIFNLEKGFAKYTKGYLRNHKGEYPVYSSQTVDEGILGYIDSYDYDSDCLTWTTDGIYAGTVFRRNNKFSMTTHCGALLPKDKFKQKLDLDYIRFQLNTILKEYATGEGNKRITVDIIEDVPIKLPVDNKGSIDIKKQKEIAKQYIKFEKIKGELKDHLNGIIELNIKIIT